MTDFGNPQQGYGMIVYNNRVIPNPARNNGSDLDLTPIQFRRYVAATGTHDIQLLNGVGQISQKRIDSIPGRKVGYLYAVSQIIPTTSWKDAAGFHKRGPAPLNVQNLWEAGPGSQPANPGGPGKIAAPAFVNPMTG